MYPILCDIWIFDEKWSSFKLIMTVGSSDICNYDLIDCLRIGYLYDLSFKIWIWLESLDFWMTLICGWIYAFSLIFWILGWQSWLCKQCCILQIVALTRCLSGLGLSAFVCQRNSFPPKVWDFCTSQHVTQKMMIHDDPMIAQNLYHPSRMVYLATFTVAVNTTKCR